MPKHTTETAPKEIADPYRRGAVPMTYIPPSRLTKTELMDIAQKAWNSQKVVKSGGRIQWNGLDYEYQNRMFDVAVDICERGAPSTEYEQLVRHIFDEMEEKKRQVEVPEEEDEEEGEEDVEEPEEIEAIMKAQVREEEKPKPKKAIIRRKRSVKLKKGK